MNQRRRFASHEEKTISGEEIGLRTVVINILKLMIVCVEVFFGLLSTFYKYSDGKD